MFAAGGVWRMAALKPMGSQIERAVEGEGEGFAGGAVDFDGPGPEGIGGVLHGAAVVVEQLDEFIAVEAAEFFAAGGLLLGGFVFAVVAEEVVDGFDGFGGFVTGEIVGGGAGDEGFGTLEEDGAALVHADAHEVAIGGEVGGGVAIDGEHAVFLFGGTLDALQGDVEGGGGGAGFEGGFF